MYACARAGMLGVCCFWDRVVGWDGCAVVVDGWMDGGARRILYQLDDIIVYLLYFETCSCILNCVVSVGH